MCHGHSEWRLVGCLIDIYLLPTLCLMGILLNSLCLAVFRTATHHPLVPTLITLSLCDLSQLTLSLFVLFIPAVHDYSESPMLGVLGQIAYLSTGLFAPLLLAANMASIWTMTYITMQRHRAIHNPLGHTAAPSRPFLPLICIVIVALTFNASKWFEYSWQFVRKEDISEPSWRESALPIVLVHQPSALAKNALYREVIDKVLYPVLVYIIPLLLLTILNFRILTTISRRPVPSDHKSRLAQERRAVTLIISIVLFFFCCHTGGLIFRWMNLVDAESDWSIVVKDVVNFLFNFNSACNPMLYFLFTRQFRDLRMSSLRRPFHGVSTSQGGFLQSNNPQTTIHSHIEPLLLNTVFPIDQPIDPNRSTNRFQSINQSIPNFKLRPFPLCRRVLLKGYPHARREDQSLRQDSWPLQPQEVEHAVWRKVSRGTIRRNTCG